MKRFWYIMLFCIVFITSCKDSSEKKEALRTVRYQKVIASKGIRTRIFSGITQSGVEYKLSFKVPGTIENLPAKVGMKVGKGEILAELDASDYKLQTQEVDAALLKTMAEARHADARYERIRQLYETRSTSRNELDAARAESESASAAVNAMQKKLALTMSQLKYTTLRAPQEGSVASVNVEMNENITTGQYVVRLNSGSNLEVKVSIPEILIADIQKEDLVKVSFDALPGKFFPAVVSEVGVKGEAGMTFPVTLNLDKVPDGIKSGMAAEVVFQFTDIHQSPCCFVPSRSVQGIGSLNYVYIINMLPGTDSGTVEKRKVELGELSNAGIKVLSGASEGELVITAGLHFLVDGQKVKVIE